MDKKYVDVLGASVCDIEVSVLRGGNESHDLLEELASKNKSKLDCPDTGHTFFGVVTLLQGVHSFRYKNKVRFYVHIYTYNL